jgi:undecaprenyl-diphosphatase
MFNQHLFYALYSLAHRGVFLDSVIVFVADILPVILGLFVAVYFVIIKKSPLHFFKVFGVVLVPSAIGLVLQHIVFRHPRPFSILPDVTPLLSISPFTSFPSMHATVFSALAVAFLAYDRKRFAVFAFFALLISLARIAAGVHFPTDILFGFLVGSILGYISHLIFNKLSRGIERIFS